MITRQTSIATYHAVVESGIVSKKRLEVFNVLCADGPLTATEIADRMPGEKSPSKGNNVHARLCELREMDLVAEVGERECSVSGRNVILWDATGRLPQPLSHRRRRRWFVAIRNVAGVEEVQVTKTKDEVDPLTVQEIVEVVERPRVGSF